MRKFSLGLSVVVGGGVASPGGGAQPSETNWRQFRGPGSRGVGSNKHLPERWSEPEHVAWKSEIPGRAWSSPIVWGERVFLATAVSAGDPESPKKGLYMGGERPNAP